MPYWVTERSFLCTPGRCIEVCEGIAALFTSALDGAERWVVSFMPWPFTARKEPQLSNE